MKNAVGGVGRMGIEVAHAPQRLLPAVFTLLGVGAFGGVRAQLRSYAAKRAHAEESEDSREEALRRMCDFYAHTSYAADRVLHPHRPDLRPDSSAHEIHVRTFTGIPDAMAWFEAEHTNLLAAQRTAAEHGWHALVGQLAWTMSVFHARQGRRRDALAVWRAALAAAEQQPDPVRHIRALRLL